MSSRPLYQPQPVIVNGNMTIPLTSLVTVISNLSMMSYQFSWAGTAPSGTVDIQTSNDYSTNSDGTVKNPGTWASLPLSTVPTISGNTGDGIIDIDQLGTYAIRAIYTPISGVGALNATFKGKVS